MAPETFSYVERAGNKLLIDAYRPAGVPKAAVIVLHGGGWRVGSKEAMADVGRALASRGLLALPMQYRLLGDAPWPAQIADVKAAIRWVRHNSQMLGIDPQKIVVEGFSAGGHLALLAAGTPEDAAFDIGNDVDGPCDVAAVIAFFAPIEFSVAGPSPGISDAARLLGPDPSTDDARRVSPYHHLGKSFPPTCLFHGTSDQVVSHLTSTRMFDSLTRLGVPVDLHLFAGHTHEFCALPSMLPHVQELAAGFIERHVVDPDFYRHENLSLNKFAMGLRP